MLNTPEIDRRGAAASGVSSPMLVIGVGNPFRGDDAAGLLVARRLAEDLPAGVRVVEASGETTELLDLWTGAEFVVMIDAVAAEAPAGTVFRFEVGVDPVPAVYARHSTHALGVGEAISLAGALDRLPPRLIVYGIVGRRFGIGEALSPAVAATLDEVAARVLADAVQPVLPRPPRRQWRPAPMKQDDHHEITEVQKRSSCHSTCPSPPSSCTARGGGAGRRPSSPASRSPA